MFVYSCLGRVTRRMGDRGLCVGKELAPRGGGGQKVQCQSALVFNIREPTLSASFLFIQSWKL